MERFRVSGAKRPWFAYVMMGAFSFFLLGTVLSQVCGAGGYRVAIDIGHTPESPGAISARGVPEYLFNKNIATLLYKKLKQDQRFRRSFIINETGENISLADRTAIAQRRGADLLLSIHHDSVDPTDLSHWFYEGEIRPYCDKFAGHSIFFSEKNDRPLESLMFAMVLGTEMLRAGFCPTLHHVKTFKTEDKALVDKTRGIYKYNQLIVLKSASMPAVLFECGIIKSRIEERQLLNPKYQARLADTLYKALRKYIEVKQTHPNPQTYINQNRDLREIPAQRLLKE
ncbi:MAG: N-acetylmuramoyl-L-alanine amidase family protein [Thermodesulfobacteriota bacterium]